MVCGVSESETISYPPDCLYSQQEIDNEEDGETNTSEVPLPLIPDSQESEPETPKRVNKLSRKDTPRAERVQETPAYTSSYVGSQRVKLIESINGVAFEWSVEDFLTHVLPPLQGKFKIDDISNEFKDKGLLNKLRLSKDYKCDGPLDTSEDVKMRETDIYNKPLEDIFKGIITITEKLSKVTSKSYFHADGNNTYRSERVIDVKPDALIFLKNSKDGCPKELVGKNWYDVVCSFEFKKSKGRDDKYEVK